MSAVIALGYVDKSIVGIRDLDGWTLDAIEIAAAERSLVYQERREARG